MIFFYFTWEVVCNTLQNIIFPHGSQPVLIQRIHLTLLIVICYDNQTRNNKWPNNKIKTKKSGNKNRKKCSKLGTNVYLSISEAPQIVRTDNLGLIRVVKGSTVTIKCKVTGFPPPKVLFKWIVAKFIFFGKLFQMLI